MLISVFITNGCNMKCSYCYEGLLKDKSSFNSNKIEALISFLKEILVDDEVLKINLHGGEPLLKFTILKELVNKIESEFNDRKVFFDMTTNGSIYSREISDYILKKNINLSISFDGDENTHNACRKFANGEGSYNIVLKNYKKYLDDGVTVRCRMTINRFNINGITKGIKKLYSLGVKIFSLTFDIYEKEWNNFIDKVENLYDELINISNNLDINISIVDKSYIIKKQGDCFGGLTSFTVTANGDIFPCIFVTNKKQFRLGNIFKYNYKAIITRMNNFHMNRSKEFMKCELCAGQEICSGQRCKLINFTVNNSYTEYCESFCLLTNMISSRLLD